MLDTLAKYLEPRSVTVSSDVSNAEVVRAACGAATPVLLERTGRIALATKVSQQSDSVTIVVPPCPRWRANAFTVLSQGETITKELRDAVGTSGPKTLAAFRQLNPTLANLDANEPLRERDAKTVKLPFVTEYSSWFLKDSSKGFAAVASILSFAGALEAEPDYGTVDLIPDITYAEAGRCETSTLQDTWPFSRADVLAVLRHNKAFPAANSRRPDGPAVIGIADLGIGDDENRLPFDSSFAEARGADFYDVDGNGYFHDVIGAHLPSRGGYPQSFPRYNDPTHGTAVASIAAGSVFGRDFANEMAPRLKLRILSLVARGQALGIGEPQYSYSIRKDALADALHYRPRNKELSILNVSVQSSEPIDVFNNGLQNSTVLVVIAAGNSSADLVLEPVYPASYGSDNAPGVIVVAAHAPISAAAKQLRLSGQANALPEQLLLSTSNRSAQRVDVAAPGCNVPAFALTQTSQLVSGTSYAAPLVSFASALLMSEGISSAARVKSRIFASVDYFRGLPVRSSGVLNFVKALSVHEDLIELRNGELIRGKISTPLKMVVGAKPILPEKLLKITPIKPDSARIVLLSDRDHVENYTIRLSLENLLIKPTGKDSTQTIPLDSIADVVLTAPEFRQRN